MDTLEKLDYRIKANIPGAREEKEKRLSDRIKLPLSGLSGESIYLTGIEELNNKVEELELYYARVPERYRVAAVILLDANSSATIEGAHTTVERMKKCIQNPESRDEIMVANAYKACRRAYEQSVTEENIRGLWEIITEDVCENEHLAGEKYRSGMVLVASGDREVHNPAQVNQIPDLMAMLFQFHEESELHPIIKSFIFHFYLVYVHPFCDGNGRIARTINNSQLYFGGYRKVKSVAIAEAINTTVNTYYKVLRESEKVIDKRKKEKWLDISPFVFYMMEALEQGMVNAALANENLTETEIRILDRMNLTGVNAEITVKNAMKVTEKKEDATRKALNSLANKGYLQVDKSSKTHIWKLVPDILDLQEILPEFPVNQ